MTRKLVLHVVESLGFGGVESHMKIIGLNMDLSDFEHQFCAIARGGVVADELAAIGRRISILGVRSRIPSLAAIAALTRLIREVRPDVIHAHGAEANFHGLIAGRICRVPVCLAEEIGYPSHSFKARITFRMVYRLADVIVAISGAVQRKLVELGEVKLGRSCVLLNPTQMLGEHPPVAASKVFEVGFVGRLEAVKNPLALIHAAALLRAKQLAFRMILVGDGSQRVMLEEEILRLNLEGVVSLAGFNSRPFSRLAGAALYVQPSLSEGFGLALVEAMSAGIPVLATPVGGAPEIITDGKNGWLLSGTNAECIAARIAELAVLDRDELRSIGRAGRVSVVERFAPAGYIRNCDALYHSQLEKRPA